MRRILALVVLLALGHVAIGGPPEPARPAGASTPAAAPLTIEEATVAVLAAIEAKDAVALKALSAKEYPDPWLVADQLLARNEPAAADRFAIAAPRKAIERLPAYLVARRGKPTDEAARRSYAEANDAMVAGNPTAALEALGPPDSTPPVHVVGVLHVIGRGLALAALGRFEESVPHFLSAADAAERLGWLSQCARALQRAGVSSLYHGNLPAALSALERGLKIAVALGDRLVAGAILGALCDAQRELGNYPKALEYGERALKAQEEAGERAGVASALGLIGGVQYYTGNFPKALEAYERAMKVAEEIGDRRVASQSLGGIAIVHSALGSLAMALEIHERNLKIQDEIGDRAGAAATRANIASLHSTLGNYPEALEGLAEALTALEALEDRAGAATVLRGIGGVHASLGDYPKALAYYERALRLQEALGSRAGVAETLIGIANVHDSLANYPKALELHEQALAILEELGSRASMALTLANIGGVHASRGNHAKALEYAERALKLEEALGDRLGAAWTLACIGRAHRALGNFAKALEYAERALTSQEKLGDRAAAADTLDDIGAVYQALGNFRKAVEYGERSLAAASELGAREVGLRARCTLARAHLALGERPRAITRAREAVEGLSMLASGLADDQGAGVRERFSDVYGVGARAAAGLGATGDVAYFLESGRAGALLESLKGRDALRVAALPEPLRVAEAEASAKEASAVTAYRKALEGKDLARILARRTEMVKAQDASREVVGRIQREAKAAASLFYPKADTLEVMQKRLRKGDALVSYGLFSVEPMALVVTMTEARVVRLPDPKEIEAAVDGFEANRSDSVTAAPLAALRKAVIEPLALGKDVTRVLVSPEGALSYVPFAALFEGLDVAYEPSETTYGLLLEEAGKRGDGVLALGDPDYQTKAIESDPALVRGGSRLKALPGTREEAKSLGSKVLLGTDASEAQFRDAVTAHARWRAVHFACHGLVDPERPAFSSLALTPTGDDDGFLTALEVFRAKVPADLVVLSACETGKGKIVRGEGIVGLTRAFMFAGSPRVICSLWKVNDEATRALMTKFYASWNPKDGSKPMETAAALRAAQEFVRSQEKWQHPYYWAAWVLWGLGD